MEKQPLYAVIRIRGRVSKRYDIKETLKLLRLHRKFHMVLVPATDSYKGMLQKVKDTVTWGEISQEVLLELLKKRGRVIGNRKLTEEYIKEKLGLKGFSELAEKLYNGELSLTSLDGVKPIFRLHPPKGGFNKSTKRPYRDEGELGYRGDAINSLIMRMI
ncbi:MAG: 50S ribosomal protein L30 [Candidatus Asgardarchaeia archaeon]